MSSGAFSLPPLPVWHPCRWPVTRPSLAHAHVAQLAWVASPLPGALITRRAASSLLAPSLATWCWVPPGTSQALLLRGPWGLNIPGQKHQSMSLRELTKRFLLLSPLGIMLISKGHRSLKYHEAMICQTPTQAFYTHELGSPSVTLEADAIL